MDVTHFSVADPAMRHLFLIGLGVLVLCCASLPVAAQSNSSNSSSLENLAGELARLRGEVEALNAELERKQAAQRSEMVSLAAQKGELEANKRRELLAIAQLEQKLEEARQQAQQLGAGDDELRPIISDALQTLTTRIENGMPFKRAERLSELDELRRQIEGGTLSPPRAANRLWSFYEDELRLTRENGLYSQTIELEGESVLADVAKLGTLAMYFRTKDGRVGYAAAGSDGSNWNWRLADNTEAIAKLFDALRKQIRTGYFELPNPGLDGASS